MPIVNSFKEEDVNLKIRPAILGDLEFIFNLRNEDSVRKASFNSKPISLEVHREWFKKRLASDSSFIFISELDGRPMGQVRFDLLNLEEAEVNIALSESSRGKGYGSEILKKSSSFFFNSFPSVKLIRAYIKSDNQGSLQSFAKAGYQLRGEAERKGQHCFELVLTR